MFYFEKMEFLSFFFLLLENLKIYFGKIYFDFIYKYIEGDKEV